MHQHAVLAELSLEVANGQVLVILKEKPNNHPKPNQPNPNSIPKPAFSVLFMYLHIFGFFYSLLLEFVEVFYMQMLGKEVEKCSLRLWTDSLYLL